MNRSSGWRMTGAAVFLTALMATVVQAQQPTLVLSLRGIEPLLNDAEFIGGEAGQEGVKANIEEFIGNFTGGKGLAGIDQTKPLGVFWNAVGAAMPVAFLPVSDVDALKELLTDLTPDFKDAKGQWTMTVNDTKLFAKVVGKYCFVSNDVSTLSKLPDPAKIVNTKYDVAFEISIASLPTEFKEAFLTQFEASGRQALENGPEPTETEKITRDAMFEGMLTATKSLINDGDRLTLGVDVDEKTRQSAIDFSITGKPNTGMAKAMTAFGKTQPAFAGIGSEAAPFRLVLSYPTTSFGEDFDKIMDSMQDNADAEIDDSERFTGEKDRAAAKNVVARLVDLIKATIKSGSMHSGMVLESGSDDTVVMIGGTSVAKGDEAAKLLDDVIKLSKENPDLAKVKVDVAKHSGARIHEVALDQTEETEKQFGAGPAHLAFRADSLWMSMGGDNLKALKKALDQSAAKPATSRTAISPISLQVKPGALVLLMEKDDEGLIERAKEIAGEPGDKLNVEIAPVPNGAKLRIEFGIDLLKLAEQP